jgi:hypothetical protein
MRGDRGLPSACDFAGTLVGSLSTIPRQSSHGCQRRRSASCEFYHVLSLCFLEHPVPYQAPGSRHSFIFGLSIWATRPYSNNTCPLTGSLLCGRRPTYCTTESGAVISSWAETGRALLVSLEKLRCCDSDARGKRDVAERTVVNLGYISQFVLYGWYSQGPSCSGFTQPAPHFSLRLPMPRWSPLAYSFLRLHPMPIICTFSSP